MAYIGIHISPIVVYSGYIVVYSGYLWVSYPQESLG